MFGLDDFIEGIIIGGAGVVLGGALVRPVIKLGMRGYLAVSDRVRGVTAVAGESIQEVYTEAKYERESQHAIPVEEPPPAEPRPPRRTNPDS